MKLSIGIVGLPNVGKSTLFKILTKQEAKVANYPFVTIDPNVGVVAAPDERLKKIARVVGSKEVLPAVFEFVDIAGLVKGAHRGAGLGNQFLARIRECDAIIHLVRVFRNAEIIHFESEPDPVRDLETILEELKLKDEESKERENLLSVKPQLVVLNGKAEEMPRELINKINALKFPYLSMDLKSMGEDKLLPRLEEIFGAFYKLLDLITFYTVNENEARSWFVKKGVKAPQAAGVVHTDFEKKFIKADVVNWRKFIDVGGWQRAKLKGFVHLEGKDYVIQDGDVIVVKHS